LARIFYASVLGGVLLTCLLAAVYPLPQHERFRSAISVIADGGREESFFVDWPQDRIGLRESAGLVRAAGALVLPVAGRAGPSAELFRLRDAAGNVVGLASRVTSGRRVGDGPEVQGTDWVLLLPARGTLFLTQMNARDVAPQAAAAGLVPAADAPGFWAGANRYRITAGPAAGGAGSVTGGAGEFAGLRGTYDETWELQEIAASGSTRGRIALVTRMQGQ
jgi:hypothetical protein